MIRNINLNIIVLLLIFIIGCNTENNSIEKRFYALSDLKTNVYQLTVDLGNDHIFYQEPNYFNPQNTKFIFKSDREGQGLYLLDIDSGEIVFLTNSFGHIPTWSDEGNEIFIGDSGKIIAIDTNTLQKRIIDIPGDLWITFIHSSPSGKILVFIEEDQSAHLKLSVINTNGTGYKSIFAADHKNIFYFDHPIFMNEEQILVLTRGINRNFTGDFNKPYILNISGNKIQMNLECSHYDVNLKWAYILCASEGYIIDYEGNIIKSLPVQGHGVWAQDSQKFLLTADPGVSSDYFNKIILMDLQSDNVLVLISHESTYNSSLDEHIQPNAQYSRDGKYVIYESDRGRKQNTNLYLVEVPNLEQEK